MNVTKSSNNARWHGWTNDVRRMFEHLLIASKGSRRIWTETSKSVWQGGWFVEASTWKQACVIESDKFGSDEGIGGWPYYHSEVARAVNI